MRDDQAEIMDAIEDRRGKLEISKENINLDGEFSTISRYLSNLTEEKVERLDGDLTLQEVSTALKNMKNNKSSGTDGFNVGFYKFL